jgi:predicted O-methyltransferase YrrM
MTLKKWTAVEEYITDLLVRPDRALDAALRASSAAGLPAINVTPDQGKLLWLLARAIDAKSILEIGTLGGYSTIWLASALPTGGRLTTLEVEAKHAKVAKSNVARAGLSKVIDVRLGKALDTLKLIEAEGRGPFDLTFIDADKPNNAEYFQWAVKLSRPGSLIIVDNVIREGEVIDPTSKDPGVVGTRKLNKVMAAEKRVSVTEIQTVGSKGYDGFAIALVLGEK